jgi:pyruvate dehydrogenase E2 component (dihydrolipoamide acetyltransferase)
MDQMQKHVVLPQMAEYLTSAKISAWLKREGETVQAGEPLVEVEADKATVEIEAPASGVLQQIRVVAGVTAAIGAVLGTIAESVGPAGPVVKRIEVPAAAQEDEPKVIADEYVASPDPPHSGSPAATPACRSNDAAVTATPLAQRMAAVASIDITTIPRLDDVGRVTKADVERALWREPCVPAPADRRISVADLSTLMDSEPATREFLVERRTAAHRVAAARPQESNQTPPHFCLHVDCVVDSLLQLRTQCNAHDRSAKLTITDFLVFLVARALTAVPDANASWVDDAVRVYDCVDIAVAADSPKGLITPIVRAAHRKNLSSISVELRTLTERARRGELKPEEYSGGTFTISNLGTFGAKSVTPIVNPLQRCILGVGRAELNPIVRNGQLATAHIMSCTLAADHRAIDGVTGAKLLNAVRQLIEDPISVVFGTVALGKWSL